MRFFLIFVLSIPSVSGGLTSDISFSHQPSSISGILKAPNQKGSNGSKRRVTFGNDDQNRTYIFEVRRYYKSWDWMLYLIEDTEANIPSSFKGAFFAAVGVLTFQYMLYNPIWLCKILAGRSCYVFTKRLYALFGKRLQKGVEPPK